MFATLSLAVVLTFVKCSEAVIYRLNESDYALMPPPFHLDPYEACYRDPEALYCTIDLILVSDEPSPLLTMIQEYSAHKTTHFNYTLVQRGVCVTENCKKFYENPEGDLKWTLEACANESFYNKYRLKTKVLDDYYCSKRDKSRELDVLDITVGIFCVLILSINIIVSLCDYFFEIPKDVGVFRFAYCFSLLRNWKKLTAPSGEGCEPRLQRLKGLHGMRTMTLIFVTVGHSIFNCVVLSATPENFEWVYLQKPFHILFNGTLIMQTFFIMSAFLLIYNWLIYCEKVQPSWKMMPKLMLMRWLRIFVEILALCMYRLTPTYAVILALEATWFGRLSSGPYWKKYVGLEMYECRRKWWQNLLYINNYIDSNLCMVQTWFLSSDTQLYIMAAIVFLSCRTPRARNVTLSLLFIAGLIIPAMHTYFQDLDGVLVISPETIIKMFQGNRTFAEVYKKGHTNIAGFVIGMATGYFIYGLQKNGLDPNKYKKYRFLYWATVPLGVCILYTGSVYYEDRPRPSVYVNMLYAALLKPAFGLTIAAGFLGVLLQVEDVYRSILEWRYWTILSRLSYATYLLHVTIIKHYVASQTATMYTSVLVFLRIGHQILLASFVGAFIFWMLVEAPFANLIRESLKSEQETKTKEDSMKVD